MSTTTTDTMPHRQVLDAADRLDADALIYECMHSRRSTPELTAEERAEREAQLNQACEATGLTVEQARSIEARIREAQAAVEQARQETISADFAHRRAVAEEADRRGALAAVERLAGSGDLWAITPGTPVRLDYTPQRGRKWETTGEVFVNRADRLMIGVATCDDRDRLTDWIIMQWVHPVD